MVSVTEPFGFHLLYLGMWYDRTDTGVQFDRTLSALDPMVSGETARHQILFDFCVGSYPEIWKISWCFGGRTLYWENIFGFLKRHPLWGVILRGVFICK